MDLVALVVAVLAALFTFGQWREAKKTRETAESANELAKKVEARQGRADERAAVQWRARRHPRYEWVVQFENTGQEAAYEANVDPADLTGVRHRRDLPTRKVDPGDFHTLDLVAPRDLADMPDEVRLEFKLKEEEPERRSLVVSLSQLREEFDRVAQEDRLQEARWQAAVEVASERPVPTVAPTPPAGSGHQSVPTAPVPPSPDDPPPATHDEPAATDEPTAEQR